LHLYVQPVFQPPWVGGIVCYFYRLRSFRLNHSLSPIPTVRFVRIDAAQAGQRLDNFLLRTCKGVPKSHLYKAVRAGEVRVNKGRTSVSHRLAEGDVVRIPPLRLPAPAHARPVPRAAFAAVFEDDALLVIDKPAGLAVHGGSGVAFGVIEQLRASRPEARFLELAHRLDRETSGLLILAKSRKALLGLHAMFRAGAGRKHYLALVEGDWVNDRQHLRQPLFKYLTPAGERRVRVSPEGKPAHTIVTLRQRYGRYSLVNAELRTGRTHQIRVHLRASGHPIVGDDKYGHDDTRAYFASLGLKRMFLHAWRLDIPHPLTGNTLELRADLPQECARVLDMLSANGCCAHRYRNQSPIKVSNS